MENNLDNLVMLLGECRNELHAPGLSEDDLQSIISKSNDYIHSCADELERTKSAIELTSEQLAAVRKAREDSEAKASTAAAEENDARIAAEMAQKMLDDAAMVYNIANTDTAKILKRAALELQEIIRTANAFYKQKVNQREKIDKATVNFFAREKSFEYAVARAFTNESVSLKEKIIAEKMAEIKVAEKEIIGWLRQIDQLAAEKESARFDEVLAELEVSLSEAEQREEDNSRAEEEEKTATASYLTAQKEACAKQVRELEDEKAVQLGQKQYKEEELVLAKADALSCADMKNVAAGEVTRIGAEAEQAINESRIEKETAVKRINDKLDEARQLVATKEMNYRQAEEILNAATAHFGDLKEQTELLKSRNEETKAEEESARDAAEVARRLADNAIKVRMSIRAESAELLLQAQEVLADSARVAEELKDKKYAYRMELEKQYQITVSNMELAGKEAEEASHSTQEAKRIWNREEESLVKEIKTAETIKTELDHTFELKIKEYNDKLAAARIKEEDMQKIADEADEKVKIIKQEIETLDLAISNLNAEIDRLESEAKEVCDTYTASSEERLSRIGAAKQAAIDDTILFRQKLTQTHEAVAAMESREKELQIELEEAKAHAESIIDMGKEQVMAVEAEIEMRRNEERLCHKATEEVAEYLQSLNITVFDEDNPEIMHTVVEASSNMAKPMEESETETESEADTEVKTETKTEAKTEAETEESEMVEEDDSEAIADAIMESMPLEIEKTVEAETEDTVSALEDDMETVTDEIIEAEPAETEITTVTEEEAEIEAEAAIETEEPAAAEDDNPETFSVEIIEPETTEIKEKSEADVEMEESAEANIDEILAKTGEEQEIWALPEMNAPQAIADWTEYEQADTEEKETDELAITEPVSPDTEELKIIIDTAEPAQIEEEEEIWDIPEAKKAAPGPFAPDNGARLTATQQTATTETVLHTAEVTSTEDFAQSDWPTENEAEKIARMKAAEAAEEAAIMAGLSGNMPRVNKDEGAEYKAWLDLISSDVIEKLIRDDEAHKTSATQATNFDDWMENLAKNFDREDAADKNQGIAPNEAQFAKTSEEYENEDQDQDLPDTEKEGKKKVKRGFRFF